MALFPDKTTKDSEAREVEGKNDNFWIHSKQNLLHFCFCKNLTPDTAAQLISIMGAYSGH